MGVFCQKHDKGGIVLTLNELIEKAEFATEEEYSNEEWRQMVETVLSDLTQYAKVLKSASELNISADGEVDMSGVDNLHEVVSAYYRPDGFDNYRKLRRLAAFDLFSEGWKQDQGALVFQVEDIDGQGKIDYYEQLYLAEDGSDYTLNLPEKHHEVVLRGLCAAVMQKEEHMDLKADYQGEYMAYYNAKEQMKIERAYEMEPWNRVMMRTAKITGQMGAGG